jgi:hypothetical protein
MRWKDFLFIATQGKGSAAVATGFMAILTLAWMDDEKL